MSKTKEVSAPISAELAAQIMGNIPVEEGYQEVQFPRINFISKDVTEESKKNGKKVIDVVIEAGTFVKEVYDATTKEFTKEELGKTIDVTFVYERKQLKHYSEADGYTSSPIFDTDDEIIPLFNNKKTVARGTAADLCAKADYTQIINGKKVSTLKEEKILYCLYEGEMHMLAIRGSSSWNFSKFKKQERISLVVTTIDSEEAENGSNHYNKMTFAKARDLNLDEAKEVLAFQTEIKDGIKDKQAYFAKFNADEESSVDIAEEFKITPKGMDLETLPDGKKF